MQPALSLYARVVTLISGRWTESAALLLARIALAGIFWRSGRTKVTEGSWLEISDITYVLFDSEYAGVPLPPEIAAPMATYAEHLFPILLVVGLATRFSALSLLLMTLVIQIFVYPEAWWSVHIVWAALAGLLIVRGGGLFSLDALMGRKVQG
ncbi:DoxX family protein [Qipengyuania marisflavi]|uniref:DoxX family protein n=1 Tax=Qipengyuania marisflavi TaxID=2486356 RepID=A0A5S3P3F3_9SPHN|nr:DoxX family protein [Qipengyuania marisflavi]TMM47386.1 DoxX family protein [Qipengyuania marisflavi]